MVIPREAGRTTYSTEIRNLKKRLTLNNYQRSIVIGSLLGDGSLVTNWSKTNFSLQIAHSIKQEAYILWKYQILKDWILSKPRYYERNKSITIKTISHQEITELAILFYPNGKKIIPDNIQKLINGPVVIAIWFMDDGNIIKRKGLVYGYHLNTQSFGKSENIILSQMLKDVYGIENMLELNHGRFRLRIMRKESRAKFREIVGRYILPEMKYKLG